MNEPQVWTLIGVFAAIMMGGLTLVATTLSRVIRVEVSSLHARFDHLDRDVQALADHVWRRGTD